jgi:hypothetical protein
MISIAGAFAYPPVKIEMRPIRIVWFASFIIFGSHALTQTPPVDVRARFEAHRLQMGTFRYSDSSNGKVVGESTIRVQRSEQKHQYVFSNVVVGASDQRWKAVIAPNFSPISAELTFGGGGGQHKAFDLSYSRNYVSGVVGAYDRNGLVYRRFREEIASDTVDQRIDWAAVMALKSYQELEAFSFHVYDPKAGNSQVVATVKGFETIHTRAGAFRVVRILYRTEKADGAQTFEVFVNEQVPRFLVKEVFPWGMTSELVGFTTP